LGDAISNRILKSTIKNRCTLNWGDAISNRILKEIKKHGALNQRLKIAAPWIRD